MMRRLVPVRGVVSCVSAVAPTSAFPRASHAALITGRRHAAEVVPERQLLFDNDSFLSGSSAMYMDELYQQWKKDPASVDASWAELFSRSDLGNYDHALLDTPICVLPTESSDEAVVKQSLADCGRLIRMIHTFEDRGHLMAQTDPLNYMDTDVTERTPSRRYKEMVRLDLAYFGFSDKDLDRVVRVGFQNQMGGVYDTSSPPMTIRQLHELLTERYCGRIGFELVHLTDGDAKRFVRSQIELKDSSSALHRPMSREERLRIWDTVASAVFFEDFFKRKYSTQKRFGCDGAETMVAGLRALLEKSSEFGVQTINLGMAHRGRLNVLCHVIGKPFEVILKEFVGVTGQELHPFQIQSDVKYHLGYRGQLKLNSGKVMQTEMLCNPSHLEAVNPFVQGYTRAMQVSLGEKGREKVLPIEIHGDAAFAGQGVAFETMCISEVGEQDTGGTVHVVCNNQIGFTTDPKSSRSSAYCTDLGRVYNCPILHVNGDYPEEVIRVFEFAAEYRARFHKSVVIDLVCYRRFGHNENDDPSITQPLMYERVRAMPDVFRRYTDALITQGIVTPQQSTQKAIDEKARYGSYQEAAAQVNYAEYLKKSIPDKWKCMKYSDELGNVTQHPTAITQETVNKVLKALKTYPEGFQLHPKLKAVLDRRNETIETGEGIEWGTAEALAFGSLLLEGHQVRVTGEDVERGTFAQRHAVIHDQSQERTYVPLAHISDMQGRMIINNSPLSEYGMLGYAAGYSLYDPTSLVIWEAQYGDFANGATIVFDQFLSAGESKWNQQQSCIVTLPHGYDGKGAEHSSGRLERFLQMSSEDVTTPAYSKEERAHRINWEIAYPSTPAQYFHLLRRHQKRNFRKALVIFFSKKYLRAPNVSTLEEFTNGEFQSVIPDLSVPASQARRLVMCTGQIYHYLNKYRETKGVKDVALVRVEELSPFPVAEVQQLLAEYEKAELMWAQEEPKNMGSWAHVEPRIEEYTKGERELRYAGRSITAAPSTGYKSKHDKEQEIICEMVFH
ncbi:2-oxoglutarate dehydrogenase subunit [Leishmania donovani]|uniref:oxoglutarate dehydrogenase (succinyl-transferring) n=4 Tax=Leishmania donovani species complex TaxID=38574 RepID=A0A6L0XX58_LEIIN|nr:putative 2-oxoglutarate dehydrogenase E1 component [Leishmania infantum JPCM5]AYU83718.1 2-oxoglutarate dehydrogenase subunit, putative [Leishmania donovani]CAC9551245.1 2-oxoglutarate_dehydrogenase_subunit_-_putative [Leishmania infantum]CAJ1993736.1 2-oxoglutarate dehydrogenase subunit [Leishmania donovani]CAM72780.1 putative 2-oxoglutarate dehydrogenase E1 component [Leishmania infantum JPCM5]SUZ46742.1 2-oxoglutarate_dehydrogenase_subunit_-_putative [Leishmania infantum]|eukprot:XP_001469669.1 putative 2-oxoglutarate dehydrogenase E1 component [Leishmania infantum JPCM5]